MTTPVYDSVAYLASDKFAVFNAAGDSFTSEFAPGLRLRADCGTDGVLLGTVATASFDAATGRTVVTTAMDSGAALTANLAEVLHGNALPESLCAHATLHALGGRDALPAASAGVSGLVALASCVETQAGTSTVKAVTPAGLAASAKGLIATNTTIYVATTGSDTTGTGTSGAPYASISKALSSIAGKLIASGATVTIQVADGTYTISSSIIIDHPDADKIQILGNTSAETTTAISSIDTTAKTFTVAGNHVSNADTTTNIQAGDNIDVVGSSTSGLNGDYLVSGVNYDGSNTIVTCSSETLTSSIVGGASIVISPANRCRIDFTPAGDWSYLFDVTGNLGILSGFRLASTSYRQGILLAFGGAMINIDKIILHNGFRGVSTYGKTFVYTGRITVKGCLFSINAGQGGDVSMSNVSTFVSDSAYVDLSASNGGSIRVFSSCYISRNTDYQYSPGANTAGNANAYISTE